MPRPLVSLCMIVKNEEENLPGCLESVRELVDEIVVVDTGSADGTVRVAQSFGARVFTFPWRNDFAAARNESIARSCGEWVLYLDPDERLDTGGRPDCIREAASQSGIDAWSVRIRNYKHGTEAFDITLNIRLFRRLSGVMFENEVHERIEPSLARMGARVAVAPFSISHFGYRLPPDQLKMKLERNLALSAMHLEREPDDSYCLYYVGVTLLLLERYGESRHYLTKALKVKDLPLFLHAMLRNLAAYLCLLEGNAEEALEFAAKSRELVPRQNTAHLLSALSHFHRRGFEAALPLLAGARDFLRLAPEQRQTDLSQEYAFIDDSECCRLIAICCAETNRYAEAVSHFKEYMKLRSPDADILKRAGICCINSGEFGAGLEYLEQAVELGAARPEVALPMAFACLQTGDVGRAEALVDEARTHSERDRELEVKVRDLLESRGRTIPNKVRRCAVPRISLCMIVRNEEQRLAGCLESVRGEVDEIVVVDTGSSDKTLDLAKSFGAGVFQHPWQNDFSKARNESLRHATGDWIFYLDADERLDPAGKSGCLRKAASIPGADAFYVPILNRNAGGTQELAVGKAVRLFRNIPGIRFSGRVHEAVDRFLIEEGAKAAHAGFAVEHLGYGQDQQTVEAKYRRNLALLEQELYESPENALARYHLGLTCVALKLEDKAREAFDLALGGKGLTPSLEAMILNMKSYHHLRAGELDPALAAAAHSLLAVPVQNTARLLKGLVLFQKRNHGEALPLLLEAYRFISTPLQKRISDISYEDSIDKSDLIEIIGLCFSETGRFKEAVPFLKLSARMKEDPSLFERLGICLLNTGDFSGAAEYLEKAGASGASNGSLVLPLSFACFRTGDFARAAEYFCSAEPGDSGEVSVAFQLIRAMAAEKAFRPFLSGCIRSKRDVLSSAFPEEFSKFSAQFE